MCHRPREELARVLLSLILVLLTFAADCQSAPIPNPRSPWREDEGAPTIFTSSCDPVTGRCLEWLPIVDSHLGDYIIEPDSDYDRAQLIQTRDVDKVSGAWREATSEDRNLGGFGNQMITSRLAKKDVFMSRGWGAGGMPFSVLYMSPRTNHPPPSGAVQVEATKGAEPVRKNGEPPNARINQPNNRVAPRNGGSSQPRRHYSIIPQLFISYGWGPSGK